MNGIVAAGDRLTALAGAHALRLGGNAFDAAVAAVFAACTAEPALTSCGGGGFLLSHEAGGGNTLYDFFVNVPSGRCENVDFYPVYVDFGSTVQEFHIGCGSIAVPGTISGLLSVHRERGRLPLEDVLSKAIEYAERGVELSDLQRSFVLLLKEIFTATESSRRVYAPIFKGERFSNRDFASFLRSLVDEGERPFYSGSIADAICKMCSENGGMITKEDLSGYSVCRREPLRFRFRDYEVLTNPPPSTGGILIAFTLKLLEDRDLGEWGSLKHLKFLIEALSVTSTFRLEAVDGNPHDEALASLIANAELVGRFKGILSDRVDLWGNTTHVSVVDGEGNAVSVTTTNGEGSGWIAPGTGIMLNNMMGEEDLNPSGFFRWPSGVRLPSMMSPTVVLKGGKPVLCLGSAGSNRIRSAIVQVILNSLVFGMSLPESVKAPRLHYERGTVYVEPGFPEGVIAEVERHYKVVLFSDRSLFFGGVQAVSGDLEAAGDDRRGGYVVRVQA